MWGEVRMEEIRVGGGHGGGGRWQSYGFSVNKPSAWPSQLVSGGSESSLAKWKGQA